MSNVNLKGNRKLKKSSKKSSKKTSMRGSNNKIDIEDKIEDFVNERFENKSFHNSMNNSMNNLNNPNNIDFDPLHVNYIIPSYDNLNINNYGISFEKMMGGNQNQFLKNTINNKFNSFQPTQPMMSQPMQAMEEMENNNIPTDSEIFTPPQGQSGGGISSYKSYNTRTLRKY